MLHTVVIKGSRGDVPPDIVAILVTCAVLPMGLLVAVAVQIVFNEVGVNPLGTTAETIKKQSTRLRGPRGAGAADGASRLHPSSTNSADTPGFVKV